MHPFTAGMDWTKSLFSSFPSFFEREAGDGAWLSYVFRSIQKTDVGGITEFALSRINRAYGAQPLSAGPTTTSVINSHLDVHVTVLGSDGQWEWVRIHSSITAAMWEIKHKNLNSSKINKVFTVEVRRGESCGEVEGVVSPASLTCLPVSPSNNSHDLRLPLEVLVWWTWRQVFE